MVWIFAIGLTFWTPSVRFFFLISCDNFFFTKLAKKKFFLFPAERQTRYGSHGGSLFCAGFEFISAGIEFGSTGTQILRKQTQILSAELDSCAKKWASVASVHAYFFPGPLSLNLFFQRPSDQNSFFGDAPKFFFFNSDHAHPQMINGRPLTQYK